MTWTPAQPTPGKGDDGSEETGWRALVARLSLQPHPEGGYYRETFRSDQRVSCHGGRRSAATSIYYLLADGACSAWHRIDADETWYFHAGGVLALHVLSPNGAMTTHLL
jgi:predicted cupin superfamily sugar epimerase